jgi:streptogramin lyase
MIPRIFLSLALLAGAASAQDSRPPAAGLQGYKVDPSWPKKPAAITWGDVPGVAVDAKDNVWMFTRHAPNLQIYPPEGELLKTWPDLEHKSAHHLKFDGAGNVWLADVGLHAVRKYSPDGKLLLTLGTPAANADLSRRACRAGRRIPASRKWR